MSATHSVQLSWNSWAGIPYRNGDFFFFLKKGKINQYIKIITISITTAQIMNPSALSSTEHKNFIYNDLIVYAFIISWWNRNWKTLNVSKYLNSGWHSLLKLPECKCLQCWPGWRRLLKLRRSFQPVAICGSLFGLPGLVLSILAPRFHLPAGRSTSEFLSFLVFDVPRSERVFAPREDAFYCLDLLNGAHSLRCRPSRCRFLLSLLNLMMPFGQVLIFTHLEGTT